MTTPPKKSSERLADLYNQLLAWEEALDLLLGPLRNQTEWKLVRSKILHAINDIEVIIERWRAAGD